VQQEFAVNCSAVVRVDNLPGVNVDDLAVVKVDNLVGVRGDNSAILQNA
jgi:hypothetical protein